MIKVISSYCFTNKTVLRLHGDDKALIRCKRRNAIIRHFKDDMDRFFLVYLGSREAHLATPHARQTDETLYEPANGS